MLAIRLSTANWSLAARVLVAQTQNVIHSKFEPDRVKKIYKVILRFAKIW